MWRIVCLIIAAAVFASACGQESRCQNAEIIAVEPYHATRVWVVYKDPDGRYHRESLFQTDSITACGVTVRAEDYLSGHNAYGAVPSQEREYLKYLRQRVKK
jgi:hypothetical protein